MQNFAKRFMDIFLTLCCLSLMLIPMLIIAIAVRLESPGKAIFKQERAGRKGKSFTMMKFRSMHSSAFGYGRSPEGSDDPRLTKIGKFLRENSLDELPQLFNVLKGDMSLVGPRPLYMRQAEQWDDRQKHRLDVLPGITGWAQINGRGEIPIEEKIELDLWYVQNRTLLLDFKILIATFFKSLKPNKDIYEKKYSSKQHREKY